MSKRIATIAKRVWNGERPSDIAEELGIAPARISEMKRTEEWERCFDILRENTLLASDEVADEVSDHQKRKNATIFCCISEIRMDTAHIVAEANALASRMYIGSEIEITKEDVQAFCERLQMLLPS